MNQITKSKTSGLIGWCRKILAEKKLDDVWKAGIRRGPIRLMYPPLRTIASIRIDALFADFIPIPKNTGHVLYKDGSSLSHISDDSKGRQRRDVLIYLVIVVLGFLFQLALQHAMRPHAVKGLYYHQLSSELLMQTVSIEDLRRAPLESLWNLHIQPPALDIIRAALATIWNTDYPYSLLRNVDRSLYIIWALLYGTLGALVFLWLSQLTRMWYAVAAALLFLAHPAVIYYSTFLDGTLLSTVLIVWTYYLVWSLRKDPDRSVIPLILSVSVLFFARSIFQWPSVLLFAAVLGLLKLPKRKIVAFLAACGGVVGLYIGKQYYKFGLTSTSSFTGLNLEQSIGHTGNYMNYYWDYLANVKNTEEMLHSLPGVLVRKTKLEGTPNFNHISYLKLNNYLINDLRTRLAATPVNELASAYWENISLYFQPSSRYLEHVIVDRLFWRNFYDMIFSAPVLPVLLLSAFFIFVVRLRRNDYAASVALALPALFVFFISVIFEKGENMRLKFFLEPVFFIFIASQIYIVSDKVRKKIDRTQALWIAEAVHLKTEIA